MFFWMWAISVCIPMASISASRDYLNEISMICSYDKTDNGSIYLHLAEDERINEYFGVFGTHRKVIFYINGYGEDMNADNDGLALKFFYKFTKDFIEDDQTVVCAFDFPHKEVIGALDLFVDYRSTVLNRVPFVAKIVKNVAAEMYVHNVLKNFDDFQIIGFSLGTHIAGVAARLLQTEFGVTVPRIFALDPAKRFVLNSENQLKKTDAKYVQAIFSSKLSQQNIDVHCKVFINDGAHQPSCEHLGLVNQIFCSHNFLPELYWKISKGKKYLIGYRDPDENKDVENVSSKMVVGHRYRRNEIGVYYANTDGTVKKKPRG